MCNNMKNLFRHMLSKRSWKQESTKYIIPILLSFRTGKTLCGEKEPEERLSWDGALTMQGHKKTFWTKGDVLCLGRDVGYMVVDICQNSWNYTIKICAFHCM